MGIALQWTGGRGGGHHSFEDFHAPLLETYAAMRAVPNVVLVVGSGFGDAKDSWPYLEGAPRSRRLLLLLLAPPPPREPREPRAAAAN